MDTNTAIHTVIMLALETALDADTWDGYDAHFGIAVTLWRWTTNYGLAD